MSLTPGHLRAVVTEQRYRCVPAWTILSAAAAPTALIGTAAAARLERAAAYDPMAQTMSVLAATGHSEVIMTIGFIFSATCQILTAAGLHVLHPLARVALAVSGCCGLAVAAFPAAHATANAHILAAGAGAILLALWPVLTVSAGDVAPVCRARWAITAAAVMCVLLLWVYYEAHYGLILGLAERTATLGEMTWPLIVVLSARRFHARRR